MKSVCLLLLFYWVNFLDSFVIFIYHALVFRDMTFVAYFVLPLLHFCSDHFVESCIGVQGYGSCQCAQDNWPLCWSTSVPNSAWVMSRCELLHVIDIITHTHTYVVLVHLLFFSGVQVWLCLQKRISGVHWSRFFNVYRPDDLPSPDMLERWIELVVHSLASPIISFPDPLTHFDAPFMLAVCH